MAEIQIDSDWKRQAEEEKRKLAEAEAARKAPSPAASEGAAKGKSRARELPAPSFAALVQSLLTQALYYLGELSPRGGEASVNLDMAKYQIDLLTVLEDKSRNNLSTDERHTIDMALYEARMRYVSVAQQFLGP